MRARLPGVGRACRCSAALCCLYGRSLRWVRPILWTDVCPRTRLGSYLVSGERKETGRGAGGGLAVVVAVVVAVVLVHGRQTIGLLVGGAEDVSKDWNSKQPQFEQSKVV